MEAVNPLFILADGEVFYASMWCDGPIQSDWVERAFDVIAVPALTVSNEELAPAEFRSRLQQQKLLVRLSNIINEVTAEYPSLFTPENIQDALATIAAWVRNQNQPLCKDDRHGHPNATAA